MERCVVLTNETDVLRENSDNSVRLPRSPEIELNRKLDTQTRRLCEKSDWKDMGRTDLVNNLSRRTLSPTELQTLSVGLKLDTGIDKRCYSKHVTKNYRHEDSDVGKGFLQGIVYCCIA